MSQTFGLQCGGATDLGRCSLGRP